MSTILALGFLLGMRHALDADHVVAVAALATRSHSARHAVLQGAVWGLGHTVTLFLACSLVLFLDTVIPEQWARALETAVGVMLLLLGADVLRRTLLDRTRCRGPYHDLDDSGGDSHSRPPARGYSRQFPARALYVGMMHGLAGSAALILLALGAATSAMTGLTYVMLFGLGSIGGMALLSLAISISLRGTRHIGWFHHSLHTVIGCATTIVGGRLVYQNILFSTS